MQETKEQQQFFMKWAIRLGEKGRILTQPRPWIGCVIVKDGEIVGEGYSKTMEDGVQTALEKAGLNSKGAAAYISLEPRENAAHSLIKFGIKKVFIPFVEPDPALSGRTLSVLKEGKIEITQGICREEAQSSLQPYIYFRKNKQPFTILKAVISIDGRVAAKDGTSKWMIHEEARQNGYELRAESSALLIGSSQPFVERPKLSIKGIEEYKSPLRILLDPKGKVEPEEPLFDSEPTLIFTKNVLEWKKKGFAALEYTNLKSILRELGKREVLQLLVEGGSEIHTEFLKENLAHRFVVYIGSCILGTEGRPLLSDYFIPTLEKSPRWHLEEVSRFGEDVRLDYRIKEVV